MRETSVHNHYVTVIDIGSNSIKMSMARVMRKSWKIVLERKKSLRLLDQNQKKITRAKQKELARTLTSFMRVVKPYHSTIKMFATSSMRRAENRKFVLKSLKKKYGISVHVISGIQEAKYVYHAIQSRFPTIRGYGGIIDIGGGSVELVQVKNGRPEWMKSIPFGSVVVKNQFFQERVDDEIDISKIILELENQMLRKMGKNLKGRLIISGGTPAAIAKIFQIQRKLQFIHGKTISMRELISLFLPLVKEKKLHWTKNFRINPVRTDLLLPCLCTVLALLRIADQKNFRISKTGLRQGIIEYAYQRTQKMKAMHKVLEKYQQINLSRQK